MFILAKAEAKKGFLFVHPDHLILVSLRVRYHPKLLRIDRPRLGDSRGAITEGGPVQTSAPRRGNKFHREILPGLQVITKWVSSPGTGTDFFPVSILLALQLDDTRTYDASAKGNSMQLAHLLHVPQ